MSLNGAARQRLAFEELLGLQLVVARRRYGIRTAKPATELTTNDALDAELQDLFLRLNGSPSPRSLGHPSRPRATRSHAPALAR